MSRKIFCTSCALALLASMTASSWAAENSHAPLPTITVRTGEHETFDRVVFDAPKGIHYKLDHAEGRVSVKFSLAAKLVVQPVKLTRVEGIVVSEGQDGAGPLVVTFQVHPLARLDTFMSGTSVVVDVKGGKVPAHIAEKKETLPSPKETTEVPKSNEEKSEPERQQSASSEPAQQEAPTFPVAAQAAPVTEVQTSELSADLVSPPVFRASSPVLDANEVVALKNIARETSPAPVAIFDPKMQVGAAVFTRGGYANILFDRKIAPSVLQSVIPPRVKLELIELPRNTGFRFPVPEGIEARSTRTDTAWSLFLRAMDGGASVSTEFVAQPDFALGARLLLPTANPPDPVFFSDPVVGDRLIILPLRETEAFTVPRHLADFQIIPAAQGLVIKPRHDKVVARIVPDGVELTAEGGLKLSPVQDSGLNKKASGANIKRFFDLMTWRGRNEDGYVKTRQKLLRTIIDVPDNQKVLAHMDLARFYMAHAMGPEAVALLENLRNKLPEIAYQPDFIGLRGASRLLAGSIKEGLDDLSKPELADQPEIVLWQGYGAALLRDWTVAAERFKLSAGLLSAYPEPFRSRFMVLAVEASLATGKDQDAAAWLAEIESTPVEPSAKQAVLYLRGVLYSKAGRIDDAEKNWREAAKGSDRLYKIRSELALVDMGVATKSMTVKQAADRLEGLRYAWRGDDLEFDILRRLGGFYVDGKEFRKGFTVLAHALRLYPESSQTPLLRAQMTKLFRDILLTPTGADISPIEALSLYMDFRFLVPSGEGGNAVRRNLAERLVDIDLLDSAAALFEDMIKNSSNIEERVKISTRLAAVRLLDHKAEAAMATLDQSKAEAEGLSEKVRNERQLLRARALSEMGKYDEALAALPADAGAAGTALHADIAMRAGRWGEASKALVDLVGPPQKDKPLSSEQAGWLVSAAVAMAQAGDTAGLDQLGSNYGNAMEKTAKADLFVVLTRPEKVAQMKNIAAAQSKLSEVDAFRGFLDAYRKDEKK